MTGKLKARDGKRPELVNILTRASQLVSGMTGCRMYIVCEEVADENAVWVFEMWEDKLSHDESLKDERVRALIGEARPILNGAPEGAELRVAVG